MRYKEITLAEMKDVLAECGGARWTIAPDASTKEHVFQYPLPSNPDVVIKLYTSIHLDTAVARRKGADAIRVCAVDIVRGKGLVKSIKCLRVEGWRNNLRNALRKVIDLATERAPRKVQPAPQVRNRPLVNERVSDCINFVWGREGKTWSAEASTIDANKDVVARNHCPCCHGTYARKDIIEVKKDDEGDILYWKFRHNCGATLIVFND